MMFTQILDPLGNLSLTFLLALLPGRLLLVLLAVLRLGAWLATLIGAIVTFGLGAWRGACRSAMACAFLYGAATGVWAVDWITFWGVILFNTLTVTGLFAAADAQFGGRRG